MKPENADFDKIVDEINRELLVDMKRAYSPNVIDRFLHPRNLGALDDADGHARVTGPCGDTMEIWLRVADGGIARAGFMTDGCGPTIACGSMATELAGQTTVEAAKNISQEDILKALGGLPRESEHCALLASITLKKAVAGYENNQDKNSGERNE